MLISVSKAYNRSSGRIKNRTKSKNAYFLYQIDENGKFTRTRCGKIEFYIKKIFYPKYKRLTFKCSSCNEKFVSYVLSKKTKLECPYC